jgi:Ricin-type beta-trefoil lectin domain-like/TIR domain
MKVFVSWSGKRSEIIASHLKMWLGDIFNDVEIWMSRHNINAGARWGSELSAVLEASSFGILCLTPENLDAPWILFEAGSLAKTVDAARVVPYLLELSPTQVRFPLAQFQGVRADQAGTFQLVESLNATQKNPLENERLQRVFAKWWPELELKLSSIPRPKTATPPLRTEREFLEEILELIRKQQQIPLLATNLERIAAADLTWGKLPPPLQVGDFYLVNVKTGDFLSAGGQSNGAPIEVSPYTGDEPQLWSLHKVLSGHFVVRSLHSGNCLDVEGKSIADGAKVFQWNYEGGDNQKWSLISHKDGSYRIRSKHSARYLSFNDSYLSQVEERDTRSQRWWLISVVR